MRDGLARLLAFNHLKWASLAHSAVYLCLLVVWIVPGLATLEFVFGLAHGIGWILMCVASIVALRLGIISLWLAVAVSVIGAVGPFVGSWAFVREGRRRANLQADAPARYSQSSHGS